MIKIFDIEEGELKINENCLIIKELKKIIDSNKDPLPMLKFIHLMTTPDSPFSNLPEEDKQEAVSDEVGGDFSLEDEDLEAAIVKLNKLYETPTSRMYEASKRGMDSLSTYLSEAIVRDGKDGNLADIDRALTNMSKRVESFKKVEKVRNEELQILLRGKAQMGMY